MEKFILASASPRRKDLLELIGIPFIVHPSQAEEKFNQGTAPAKIVEELALMKARDVSSSYSEGIIIGADTIVVLDAAILGKPRNTNEAFQMLSKLQGRQHHVYSGIAVIDARTGRSVTSHQATKVYMSHLSDEEIWAYIETGEPMDKAGSYGIQGYGAVFIERIEGDYFNVVGLPLFKLTNVLKSFGVDILQAIINKSNSKSRV